MLCRAADIHARAAATAPKMQTKPIDTDGDGKADHAAAPIHLKIPDTALKDGRSYTGTESENGWDLLLQS